MDGRYRGVGGREKGKLVAPKRAKGKLGAPEGKKENGGKDFCDPIPLGNQTAFTHERTHAPTHARTARPETISRLDSPPQPPI